MQYTSRQKGYVGLLALLISCAILVFIMTKYYAANPKETTTIQEGGNVITETKDIKNMIESRHGAAMENL